MPSNCTLPEFSFRDGTLHIRASWADMRLQWRPFVRAEEREPKAPSRWKVFYPEFRILGVVDGENNTATLGPSPIYEAAADGEAIARKIEAMHAFRQEVPESFIERVSPFTSHQWTLLKLLREERTFRDLIKANAVLAFCLANNREFRGTCAAPAEFQAVMHSHNKQREILKWLGFPDSQAVVKLFKRIIPQAASPSSLRGLRTALAHSDAPLKTLAHYRQINAATLGLLTDSKMAPLVTSALLDEVAESNGNSVYLQVIDDVTHALRLVEQMDRGRPIRPFHSLRRVRTFVEAIDNEYLDYQRRQEEARRVAAEQAARRARAARRVRRQGQDRTGAPKQKRTNPKAYLWPPPPIPGTPGILPVTSYDMLADEARTQGNCVASYWRNVVRHEAYIYRMTTPERATLAIVKRVDGQWHLSQIKATRNRPVALETRNVANRWLYIHSLSF